MGSIIGDITIAPSGTDAAVLAVTGALDVYTAPTLRSRHVDVVHKGRYRTVLDLAGVDFIDSAGLAVLVGALKRCVAHGGALVVVESSTEQVRHAFRITGLMKVFETRGTVEEALAAAREIADRRAADGRLPRRAEPQREWGHRFVHDGSAGPDESQGAAVATAKRYRPGYVEVVWRLPGGEWQRADIDVQPHTPDELVASLERSRDWWRTQSNVRGEFVTRLRGDEVEEWRKAEREALAPFNRPGDGGVL